MSTSSAVKVHHDEPATVDLLSRARLADGLARILRTCQTPLVMGVYGGWGSGKTSLMRMAKKELDDSESVRTVWFDAWEHQFDENPALALMHQAVADLGLGDDGRRLLMAMTATLSTLVLKKATGTSVADIQSLQAAQDDDRFLVREKQVRLRERYAELLGLATMGGKVRVVFFIDDLDRASPSSAMRVLEALKLFLNVPGCAFVLGVDKAALEAGVRQTYKDFDIPETDYLDKIVQVPFVVPPVTPASAEKYARELLPSELLPLAPDLIPRTLSNPRQLKRFVNCLVVNHELAKMELGGTYEPRVLLAVLRIQWESPESYREALSDPTVLVDRADELLPGVTDPAAVFHGQNESTLRRYLFLSEAAGFTGPTFEVLVTSVGSDTASVLKTLRRATGKPVKDLKTLLADLPATVISGITQVEASIVVEQLTASGAAAAVA